VRSTPHKSLDSLQNYIEFIENFEDEIPNVGFDQLAEEEEIINDEPLKLDFMTGKFNIPIDHNQKTLHKGPSLSHHDQTSKSTSSGTKSVVYERHLSTDSESGKDMKSTIEFYEGDEDEDDWNEEIGLTSQPTMLNYDESRASRQINPFLLDPKPSSITPILSEKESLLEYLETNIKRQFLEKYSNLLLSSGSNSNFETTNEEEIYDVGNNHLRGVFGWVKVVNQSLEQFSKSREGRNNEFGAHQSLKDDVWDEVVSLGLNEEHISQMLENCEQSALRESNLYSLEIIAKFLSVFCATDEYEKQKKDDSGLVQRLFQIAKRSISILDNLHSAASDQLLANCSVLKDIYFYVQHKHHRQHFYHNSKHILNLLQTNPKILEKITHLFAKLLHIHRAVQRLVDCILHLNLMNDICVFLERIESSIEQLENLKYFSEIVHLFIPTNFSDPTDREIDYQFVIMQLYNVFPKDSVNSCIGHQYTESHLQLILTNVTDITAQFVCSKLLLMTGISPLNWQRISRRASYKYRYKPAVNQKQQSRKFPLSYGYSTRIAFYNVVYDLSIGTQCHFMLQHLESPSIIRAKLSYALHEYIRCLLCRQLLWQSGKAELAFFSKRKHQNSSGKSTHLHVGTDEFDDSVDDGGANFGIDATDAAYDDATLEDISAKSVEEEIIKELASCLGSNNEISGQQLFLLLEVAVDLFPSTTGSNLNPQQTVEQQNQFNLNRPVSIVGSTSRNFVNEVDSKQKFQIPPQASSIEKDALQDSQGNSLFTHSCFALNPSINLFDMIVVNQPSQEVSKQSLPFNFLLEMLRLTSSFLSDFSRLVSEDLPQLALELMHLQARIQSCIVERDQSISEVLLERIFLLSNKLDRTGYVLYYGEELWIAQMTRNEEVAVVYHTCDILTKAYEFDGQYEMSIRVLLNSLIYVKNQDYPKSRFQQSRRESMLDSLICRIADAFQQLGDNGNCIKLLQQLVSDLLFNRNPHTLYNVSLLRDEKLINILSKLLPAYHSLNDFESCHRIIQSMKSIRQERLDGFFEQFIDLSKTSTSPQDQEQSVLSGSSSSLNSMSGIIFTFAPKQNNHILKASIPEALHSVDYNKFGSVLIHAKAYRFQWNIMDINCHAAPLLSHCLTCHSIDLGYPLAKIYHQSGLYVSALNALAPSIIGVEHAVQGKSGDRDGMLALARLYYLRGKIQYDASRTFRGIKFPFEVGSSEVYQAIHSLFVSTPIMCTRGRNFYVFHRRNPVLMKTNSLMQGSIYSLNSQVSGSSISRKQPSDFIFTCRRAVVYNDCADLLWDALKWFRKAWDLFHSAGDQTYAGKSANYIAKCHLLPSFVPFALFGVNLRDALDLSQFRPSIIRNASANDRYSQDRPSQKELIKRSKKKKKFDFTKILPPPPIKGGSKSNNSGRSMPPIPSPTSPISPHVQPTQQHSFSRFASLEEVEKVSNFALDVHVDASLPLGLIEAYMNMAELYVLRNMKADGMMYWWEAKDLFISLFADGFLLPIIRRCSAEFCRKIQGLLQRILVFLWISEFKKARDDHVFLLEMYNDLILEHGKIDQIRTAKSKVLAGELHKIFAQQKHQRTQSRLSSSNKRQSGKRKSKDVNATRLNQKHVGGTMPIHSQVNPPTISRDPNHHHAKLTNTDNKNRNSLNRSNANSVGSDECQTGFDLHESRVQSENLHVVDTKFDYTKTKPESFFATLSNCFGCTSKKSVEIRSSTTIAEPRTKVRNIPNSANMNCPPAPPSRPVHMPVDSPVESGRNRSIELIISPAISLRSRLRNEKPWTHSLAEKIVSNNILSKIVDLPAGQCYAMINEELVVGKSISFSSMSLDTLHCDFDHSLNHILRSFRFNWADVVNEDGTLPYLRSLVPSPEVFDVIYGKVEQKVALDPLQDFMWHDTEFNFPFVNYHRKAKRLINHLSYRFPDQYKILCDLRKATEEKDKFLIAEHILIERMWHLFLQLKNTSNHYYIDRFSSLRMLGKRTRQILLRYSQCMQRLRAFSKQWKPSILNAESLQRILQDFSGVLSSSNIPIFNSGSVYRDLLQTLQISQVRYAQTIHVFQVYSLS
jgi:hypothetical protein